MSAQLSDSGRVAPGDLVSRAGWTVYPEPDKQVWTWDQLFWSGEFEARLSGVGKDSRDQVIWWPRRQNGLLFGGQFEF